MDRKAAESTDLLEILKRRGTLSTTQLRAINIFIESWNVEPYRAVIETHAVDETRLADILADEFHLSRVPRLRSRTFELDALAYLPYLDAMNWSMIPYAIDPDNGIYVAISDPTRQSCLEVARRNCQCKVIFQVAERSEVEASIQTNYPLSMQLPKTSQHLVNITIGS
jgi:hypothetical protein